MKGHMYTQLYNNFHYVLVNGKIIGRYDTQSEAERVVKVGNANKLPMNKMTTRTVKEMNINYK